MNAYEPAPGLSAHLIVPYYGFTAIELIKKCGHQWVVKIIGSGLEIYVFEDEFIIDI